MAQAQGEIGAAVPFGALAGDRFETSGPEEQNLPAFLQGADVERKGNVFGGAEALIGARVMKYA